MNVCKSFFHSYSVKNNIFPWPHDINFFDSQKDYPTRRSSQLYFTLHCYMYCNTHDAPTHKCQSEDLGQRGPEGANVLQPVSCLSWLVDQDYLHAPICTCYMWLFNKRTFFSLLLGVRCIRLIYCAVLSKVRKSGYMFTYISPFFYFLLSRYK